MDRRERFNEISEAFLAAMDGRQAQMWTALPGIVQSYDPAAGTVVVQPAIQARVQNPDYSFSWVTLPQLLDVIIMFPSAGGFSITFPIAIDDEVLVILASRCVDAWWQSSGIQVQPDLRMHSLSDGFALPGPKSKPRVVAGMDTANLQIRADSGDSYIEMTPGGIINIVAPGGINLTGPGTWNGHLIDERHTHKNTKPSPGETSGAVT